MTKSAKAEAMVSSYMITGKIQVQYLFAFSTFTETVTKVGFYTSSLNVYRLAWRQECLGTVTRYEILFLLLI
jgi:hypothetical protein